MNTHLTHTTAGSQNPQLCRLEMAMLINPEFKQQHKLLVEELFTPKKVTKNGNV